MLGPGINENVALDMLADGEVQGAQVRTLLALAAAVNRLADVHASTQA